MGDILQHSPPPIRNVRRALELNAELVPIAEQLVKLDPQNARHKVNLSLVYSRQAGHYSELHELEKASASFRKSNQVLDALLNSAPANVQYQEQTAINYVLTGLLEHERRNFEESAQLLRKAAGMMEKLLAGRRGLLPHLLDAYDVLAEIACEQGKHQDARQFLDAERALRSSPESERNVK
jgi:tetratricopeptide (TPR) repeat protein